MVCCGSVRHQFGLESAAAFRVSLRVNGVLIGIVLISVALIWIGLTRIGLVPIALISPVRTRILLIVEIRTHQLYMKVLRHPVAGRLPTSGHLRRWSCETGC